MKLYDFDAFFDAKLKRYIEKNAGKYRENEWDDIVVDMYQKFGDTVIKSLGESPRSYYAKMDNELLVKTLRAHLSENVPVSEYLTEAFDEREDIDELLLPLLFGSKDEQIYCLNLLTLNEKTVPQIFELLLDSDDADFKDICVEAVKECPDCVVENAINTYRDGSNQEYMLEILARVTKRDERVYNILLDAFTQNEDNIELHANYLGLYGDERALPILLEKIDGDVNYPQFMELRQAIELLGGTYTKERDFSNDPFFKIIMNQSEKEKEAFSNLLE